MTTEHDSDNSNNGETPKQQPRTRMRVGDGEVQMFGELLIRALFSENITLDATPAERKRIYGDIASMCMVRGLSQFTEDMRDNDNSFVDTLDEYGFNIAHYMANIFDNLVEDVTPGKYTREEEELLTFFRDRGATPRPESERRRRSHDTKRNTVGEKSYLKSLREFSRALGISEEAFNDLVEAAANGVEDVAEFEQIVGRSVRKGQSSLESAESSSLGYSVICREHGRRFIDDATYTQQLLQPDKGWRCPVCDARCQLEREMDDDYDEQ